MSVLKESLYSYQNNHLYIDNDFCRALEFCGVNSNLLDRLKMCEKIESHILSIKSVNTETNEYLKHIVSSISFNKKVDHDCLMMLKDIIYMLNHIAPDDIVNNTYQAIKLNDYSSKVLFSLKGSEKHIGSQINLRHDSTIDCLDHLNSRLLFARNIKSIRTESNTNSRHDHQSNLALQIV